MANSFPRINPQVPAPARGEARLGRARQDAADEGQPALVEEVRGELDLGEVSEQLARLAPRVDARQRVARAVRVAAQELAARQLAARVLLDARRVLAQRLDGLARQQVREADARPRAEQPRARAPQETDVDAVVVRVAVV